MQGEKGRDRARERRRREEKQSRDKGEKEGRERRPQEEKQSNDTDEKQEPGWIGGVLSQLVLLALLPLLCSWATSLADRSGPSAWHSLSKRAQYMVCGLGGLALSTLAYATRDAFCEDEVMAGVCVVAGSIASLCTKMAMYFGAFFATTAAKALKRVPGLSGSGTVESISLLVVGVIDALRRALWAYLPTWQETMIVSFMLGGSASTFVSQCAFDYLFPNVSFEHAPLAVATLIFHLSLKFYYGVPWSEFVIECGSSLISVPLGAHLFGFFMTVTWQVIGWMLPQRGKNPQMPESGVPVRCSLEDFYLLASKRANAEGRCFAIDLKPGWSEGTRLTFETADVCFQLVQEEHPRFSWRGHAFC